MAFIRAFTGSDGESHLEEMDMGFAPTDMSPLGGFSPAVGRAPVHIIPEKVKGVILGSQTEENPKDLRPVGQRPPGGGQRHYIAFLGGRAELETSGGDKRIFVPGDWLLEDPPLSIHWTILDPPWQWCAIMLED